MCSRGIILFTCRPSYFSEFIPVECFPAAAHTEMQSDRAVSRRRSQRTEPLAALSVAAGGSSVVVVYVHAFSVRAQFSNKRMQFAAPLAPHTQRTRQRDQRRERIQSETHTLLHRVYFSLWANIKLFLSCSEVVKYKPCKLLQGISLLRNFASSV